MSSRERKYLENEEKWRNWGWICGEIIYSKKIIFLKWEVTSFLKQHNKEHFGNWGIDAYNKISSNNK